LCAFAAVLVFELQFQQSVPAFLQEPSKIPVSRLTPSDGKSISEETACGHASIDLPSPTFSPPSPHTAMIEISETLQKVSFHCKLLCPISLQNCAFVGVYRY